MPFPSTNATTHKALGLYFTWIDTHTNKPRLLHIKQKPALEDIPIGWFDGAASANDTRSGVGGLIKLSHNTLYKWTYNCGPGTNTRAELLGA
jgi:hypothetical protein